MDLATGFPIFEFGYDYAKRLVSVIDRFGKETVIDRTPDTITITAPDGLQTILAIDGNNRVARITYPDGTYYDFRYFEDTGLLTEKIEPEGNRFFHRFDPKTGRVSEVEDEKGGRIAYERTRGDDGTTVTTKRLNDLNPTIYDDFREPGYMDSIITDPTGAVTMFYQEGLKGGKTLPDGTEIDFRHEYDSEYNNKRLARIAERTPNGELTWEIRIGREYPSPTETLDSVRINADPPAEIARMVTEDGYVRRVTTSEGRVHILEHDEVFNLSPSKAVLPDFDTGQPLFDIEYAYARHGQHRGRLEEVTVGDRTTSYTYDDNGNPDLETDPTGSTTDYDYDAMGRLRRIFRFDTGVSIYFDYDRNGNLTKMSRPATAGRDLAEVWHAFGSDAVNLPEDYAPPGLPNGYVYEFTPERKLGRIQLPSGAAMEFSYHPQKGWLDSVTTPDGVIAYAYDDASRIDTVSCQPAAGGTETIAYGYDGSLVTSVASSGTMNRTVGYEYNDKFELALITYGGGSVSYARDNDGFLTNAGRFAISRDRNNGFPRQVSGGGLNVTRGFNGYGETDSERFEIAGADFYGCEVLERDGAGRIRRKRETVDGETREFEYIYDADGRLATAAMDGTLVEDYGYHENGARCSDITGRTYLYEEDDRLISAGGTEYVFDIDGFLDTKTVGTEVTDYTYSSRGELLEVGLPDGRTLEYIYDPLGRRIAKLEDGTVVEKYLWQGMTRLLAVYDGTDSMTMRFEYADARMPYAMTCESATYYLAYDQIGSLRLIADESGTIIKRIEYDSFGNILSETDNTVAIPIPFGFAGGLHDRDCLNDPVNSFDKNGLTEHGNKNVIPTELLESQKFFVA